MDDTPLMPYRRLGRSGLQVSALSFGSWVTFGDQLDTSLAKECLTAAHDGGVNFFDNAESYAGGESESIMGAAIAELGWPRESYVRQHQGLLGPPRRPQHAQHAQPQVPAAGHRGQPRALRARLRRPAVLPPPRPGDPDRGDRLGDVTTSSSAGQALYWGTSEWSADEIRAAWEIAERHHLHKPVMEQPQYNLLERRRVERRVRPPVRRHRPRPHHLEPARLGPAHRQVPRRRPRGQPGRAARLRVAARHAHRRGPQREGAPPRRRSPTSSTARSAQLAIAWCAANPHVSTVITGASRVEQVHENLKALEVLDALDLDMLDRIDAALAG